MALVNADKQTVLNYAEKRTSESTGVNDCVIVYELNGMYYADGVSEDDYDIMPDNATFITAYGMCSWFQAPQVDFVG